ncbi:MAG TPA: flagellar assembly protein FliH, partial [Sulfurospirillum sp. UBA11407]
MRNIINTTKIQEHSVEPYKFKVLGGTQLSNEEKEAEYIQKDTTPIFKEENDTSSKESSKIEDTTNKFVEELLKKTDELTSSMVKMQMQMEKQEIEFENRLKNEIEREAKS